MGQVITTTLIDGMVSICELFLVAITSYVGVRKKLSRASFRYFSNASLLIPVFLLRSHKLRGSIA